MKLKMLLSTAALMMTAACVTPPTGEAASARFDTFEIVASDLDFSSYDQVYLAPIKASDELFALIDYRAFGPTDTNRPVTAADIEKKAADLSEDIANALGGVAEMVDAGGEGILTIGIALTKLESNRPTMADLSGDPSLSMKSVYAGKAEVMITFSENGQTLATAKDGDYPSLNDTLPPAPIWSTADKYFGRLASKIAGLLS